jgi:hypothetical protein
MKKAIYLIIAVLMTASMSLAGPLLWRGAKTIPAGKPIFMVGLGYTTINKQYNWDSEEWADIPKQNHVTVTNAHFMLGYAPINKWEVMAHVPVMNKSRDTLVSFGLQDIWVKTRYNFLGGKTQPYLTGVAAIRIPISDEKAVILLDDQTLDFAVGAMFMQNFKSIVLHLKAGYWLNGSKETTAGDVNVGDDIEGILKFDYVFLPKVTGFLNFTWVETFKSKDAEGNEIVHSEKRRLDIIPGVVVKPIPGLTIRPKFIYPVSAVAKGSSNFTWKIGLDIWFVPN